VSDIFISYAREDRDKAKLLADGLVNQGWSVWWDRRIVPGKLFDRVIEEEISSSKCVIVLWSKSSVTSDWVRSEAEEGRNRGILIPVIIEDTRIPMAYRNMQAADLIGWDGNYRDQNYREFVQAVETHVPHGAALTSSRTDAQSTPDNSEKSKTPTQGLFENFQKYKSLSFQHTTAVFFGLLLSWLIVAMYVNTNIKQGNRSLPEELILATLFLLWIVVTINGLIRIIRRRVIRR
jgi:hypothetical protein